MPFRSLRFTPNSQVSIGVCLYWPHSSGYYRGERTHVSLMPTLEIDKAAIDAAIAEVRDDATPTDFVMLGD